MDINPLLTVEPRRETPPVTVCACGHLLTEHDPVAARYCRATAAGALDRNCVCAVMSGPLSR